MSGVGNVTFTTTGESREYRLFGPMMLVGGEPSWNVTERMRRQPVTSWNGRSLYGIEIPLVLDGWSTKRSVGNELLWIRGLLAAADDKGVASARSVLVQSDGMFRIPGHNVEAMEWVAVSLEVDASSIIRAEDGVLLRCTAVLTVQEYVEPPSVKATPSFTKAAAAKRVITIMAKKGDTPLKLSLRKGVRQADRAAVKRYFMNHKIIPNKTYRIQV